jgi:glyoxalase family protein
MTFFAWPGARRGSVGNGEIGATAYAIREESVAYWRARLAKHGASPGEPETRFSATVIPFRDPDGMLLELAVDSVAAPPRFWDGGPVSAEHALCGFHGITLNVASAERSARLLVEQMGYRLVGQEGARWRLQSGDNAGAGHVDLLERPALPPGRMGAGSHHHVAFRVRDDAEELAYQQAIRSAGFDVTPVRDRQYFHSIYWREPGGVLYEIATDPPGFTWDESVEQLGNGLQLPPWLERHRERIARSLLPITARASADELNHVDS